jgi:hypothetical protein
MSLVICLYRWIIECLNGLIKSVQNVQGLILVANGGVPTIGTMRFVKKKKNLIPVIVIF